MIVSLISFGCPKNLVDSETVLGFLSRSGFSLTTVPDHADVIIINTCAFIKPAVDEAVQEITRVLRAKRRGKVKRVVVIGCLVQRFGAGLKERFPSVDAFLGIDQLSQIGAICRTGTAVSVSKSPVRLYNEPRVLSTPAHYAYLKISDGCDNRCSYCLVPRIRGRYRSRRLEDIVAEAKSLAAHGVKELILVAQDTTLYGFDRYHELKLAELLRKLEPIGGIEWIRLLYTHPTHYTDDLIQLLKQSSKVVKYVDLPLQHIADSILKRMNRRYYRNGVEALLEKLRSIPGMKIRTTFITGFPGETKKDFDELLDFVKSQQFDSLGGFKYWREPGTAAYRFKLQVSEQTKQSRQRRLMELQQTISLKKQREWMGKELGVLIDGHASQPEFDFIGRAYFDSPEIDGYVYVRGTGLHPGDFVKVKIFKTTVYDRYGEISVS